MSDQRIKDGTGTSSLARVDADHRLWTSAVTKDTLGYVALSTGYSFTWVAQQMTLPGTSEYMILRIKNTDSVRNMFMYRFMYGWNGGSTNHNRASEVAMYLGTPAPTANYVTQTAPSTNFGRTLFAPAEAQVWDSVGNGMTVVSNGQRALHSYFEQGHKDIILGGSLIIPFGYSVGFTVKAPEVGMFSMLISAWFEEAVRQ